MTSGGRNPVRQLRLEERCQAEQCHNVKRLEKFEVSHLADMGVKGRVVGS